MKLIITDLETLPCRVDGEYKLIGPGRPFRHCVGCFGCWIKTPGVCVIHDGCELTGRDLSKCSELILVSRCVYGCTSPFVKNVLDRAISYIHPYFAVRGGEMHHRRRYENRLTVSAYFYGPDITEAERATGERIVQANAVNYDGGAWPVRFFQGPEELEGVTL